MKNSIVTLVVFISSMVFVTVSEFSGARTWQELGQDQPLGAAFGIDEQVGEPVFESLTHFSGFLGSRTGSRTLDRHSPELGPGNFQEDSGKKIEYLMLPQGVVRQFVGQLRLLPADVLLPGTIDEDQPRLELDTDKADNQETSNSMQEDFPDFADRKPQPPAGAPCDGGET